MFLAASYIFLLLAAAPWTISAQNEFVYPPPTTLAYNATLLVPESSDLLVLYVGTTVNLQWTTTSTTVLGLHLQNTNTTLPNSQYIIKDQIPAAQTSFIWVVSNFSSPNGDVFQIDLYSSEPSFYTAPFVISNANPPSSSSSTISMSSTSTSTSTSIQSTSTSSPATTSSSATASPSPTNTKASSHIGVEVGVPVGVVAVAALGGIIAWILLLRKRASKGSALPQDDMHGDGGVPPYTDQGAGGYVQKPIVYQEMDAQKPAAHELTGNGYYAPVELPAGQR